MPGNTIVYSTCMLVGALCALILIQGGLHEDAIRQTIRLTAATSYLLLICAFTARPLYQLTHSAGTKMLLGKRRQIGISVAISHSFHLAMIVLLNWLLSDGEIGLGRSLADLGPGMAVYAVLYAMALTSNNFSQAWLGKNWKRLHTLGIYSLMLAFTGAYTGNALEAGGYYWIFCAAGVAAFLLRLVVWKRRGVTSGLQPSGVTKRN